MVVTIVATLVVAVKVATVVESVDASFFSMVAAFFTVVLYPHPFVGSMFHTVTIVVVHATVMYTQQPYVTRDSTKFVGINSSSVYGTVHSVN